jgi:glutathione S-transferase
MLVLYEHSTSVCVIKVRLTLAEKGLPYEGRFVDLRRGGQFDPEYLKIHPGAVVPALVHDGQPILESSVIQYYLEDEFPTPPLMPARDAPNGRRLRYRVRWLMKFIDDPIHPACGLLTHAIAFRKDFPTPDAVAARMAQIPDPRRRERQRSVYTEGVASPYVQDAVRDFDTLLMEMERALGDGPWLGGPAYSLADAAATPYVNRLAMLGLLEAFVAHRPRVADWFARVRARPSYDSAIARWIQEDDIDHFAPNDPGDAPKLAALVRA